MSNSSNSETHSEIHARMTTLKTRDTEGLIVLDLWIQVLNEILHDFDTLEVGVVAHADDDVLLVNQTFLNTLSQE